MNNEKKVIPDAHLIYLTQLTPSQIAERIKNGVLEEGKAESFTESLKNRFHFTGSVSENAFSLKTRDNHEYIFEGKFFEEANYTKVEVTLQNDDFISKKWRNILLLLTGFILAGLLVSIFLGKGEGAWGTAGVVGLIFFALLFPNHKQKHLISSYKKKIGKILEAYELIEK